MVSDVPLGTLLPRIRELGLAPVVEAVDGTVRVARPDVFRARTSRRRTPGRGRSAHRRAHRRGRLRHPGRRPVDRRPTRSRGTSASTPTDVIAMLRQAAEAREQLVIGYVGNDGTVAERMVTPERVEGGQVTAYDERSDSQRTFALHRITAVSRPVDPPRGRDQMRTIGLLGGMSWESTAIYYQLANELVRDRLGGLHSARLLMSSVDFAVIEEMQSSGRWNDAGVLLANEARRLEQAGADLLVLCTNTMHKVAATIEESVSIPLLHLGDATAGAVLAAGLQKVGLLGTGFTMSQDFYRARLESHGLTVLVPDEDDQALVHRVIYDELCLGVVRDESRRGVRRGRRTGSSQPAPRGSSSAAPRSRC